MSSAKVPKKVYEPEIQVKTVITKVAKNGSPYQEHWCEIQVGGRVFMRKFVVFPS